MDGTVQVGFRTTRETRRRIKQHYAVTGEPGAKLINRLLDEFFDKGASVRLPTTGDGTLGKES